MLDERLVQRLDAFAGEEAANALRQRGPAKALGSLGDLFDGLKL